MSAPVDYNLEYYNKCRDYAGTEIAHCLNKRRLELLLSVGGGPVLDIGVGSGEFLDCLSCEKFGYDINPHAELMLKKKSIYLNPYSNDSSKYIHALTMWDSLEHIPSPSELFDKISVKHVLISTPIINDFSVLESWKHYRPNEHLYYFSESGLISYMGALGFRVEDVNSLECECGRLDIGSFVFTAEKCEVGQ